MNYSLNQMTTIAECDALLNTVRSEKSDLAYRQTTLNYQLENKAEDSATFNAELNAATAELANLLPTLETMTEGPHKVDAIERKMRLELRIFSMTNRADNYGIKAVLVREFDIARVEAQLTLADDLISQIEARKVQLAS